MVLLVMLSVSLMTAIPAFGADTVLYTVSMETHATFCEGSVVTDAVSDSMPLDGTVLYNSKSAGRIEFTGDEKGTVRFLGMSGIKLAGSVSTAYLEIPVKGNASASFLDLSFVTNAGTAGSFGQITGITGEWQTKRLYIKDLAAYTGTPDFDQFLYLDVYRENAAGAVFHIGDVTFRSGEETNYTLDLSVQSTWCDGSAIRSPDDAMTVDSSVRYDGNDTGKISFSDNTKGIYRFLGMSAVKLQSNIDTAYIEMAVKGNITGQLLDLSFVTVSGAAGSWGQITGITEEWQIKRLYMRDLYAYMGTPDFNQFYYFDIYRENAAGAEFRISDITFCTGNGVKYDIDLALQNTFCDGTVRKSSSTSMLVDGTVLYEGKPTGKIGFSSNAKGLVRFLGMNSLKLQGVKESAYIEIPVKGSGVQCLELSFVTDGQAAGSWGKIDGITSDWQLKRLYLKDLSDYMGTADFDSFDYFDIYNENESGGILWIGDIRFGNSSAPADGNSYPVIVSTHQTWCDGAVTMNPDSTMPLDTSALHDNKPSGIIAFTGNEKGIVRFLGVDYIKLESYKDTAYFEIPVKGNGVSDRLDFSFVTSNGTGGAFVSLTGITTEWKTFRVYVKDFKAYMGTPNLDELFYFDIYRENAKNARFNIGDITFYKKDMNTDPSLIYKVSFENAVTFADGNVVKGPGNTVPFDTSVQYEGSKTAKITFTDNYTSGSYYLAAFLLNPSLNIKEHLSLGSLSLPVKSDGKVGEIEVVLTSGSYDSGTEQIATVLLEKLGTGWQVRSIPFNSFLSSNAKLDCTDITSVQIRGYKGMTKDGTVWVGEMGFYKTRNPATGDDGGANNAIVLILFAAAATAGCGYLKRKEWSLF